MTRRLTKVEINGVDVTSLLLEWTITESYGDTLSDAQLTFPQVITSLVTLSNTATVEVWTGYTTSTDLKIFDGFVETYKPDGFKTIIYSRDKLADTVRREITQVYDKTVPGDASYPDGKVSKIALDIITTQCGLNADSTTVQDSGDGITLSKFVCNHADPLERLKKLTESLGWVVYYRADTDKVYFEPKNYTTNSTTLTVGENIIEIPKWTYDKSQMVNDLTLEGAIQSQLRNEAFDGDNLNKTFTLSESVIPSFIDAYLSATKDYETTSYSSNEKKIGVPNGTEVGTYDYTFDLKKKSFTFTSTTPLTGTNNVLAQYAVDTPSPIHRRNTTSIIANGLYKKTIPLTDVLSVNDAENRCLMILQKYSQPFVSGVVKVNVSGVTFTVGQGVNIIDNVNSPALSKLMTIRKITKRWPGNFDEFEVGDAEWLPAEAQVNMLERIKRLEETLIGDTSIVNEIIDNELNFSFIPISQTIQVDLINDSFLAGFDPNGVLYDSNQTSILNDFENVSNWSDRGVTTVKSTASTTKGTSGDYLTGTGAIQFVTQGSGSFSLRCTGALDTLTNVVGTASGTPTQGTFAIWLKTTQGSNFTSTIKLQVGSNTSNYVVYNSQTYKQKVASSTTTWQLDSGWTYLMFDANLPSTRTGTPTWSGTPSYVELKGTVSATTTFTLDYLNVSKNNTIGLNGLGDRSTNLTTLTHTY